MTSQSWPFWRLSYARGGASLMRPFALTLVGIIILVAMGIFAAISIGSGEAQQRFLILIGIIGTAITALLAVYRSEANADRIETRTDELSARLDKRAQHVEDTALSDLRSVKAKIDENTKVSIAAFEVANNFSERMVAQERFLTAKFNALLAEGETPLQEQDRKVGEHAAQAASERRSADES